MIKHSRSNLTGTTALPGPATREGCLSPLAVTVEKNPVNRAATCLVFDLRNSTVLYRQLNTKKERKLIIDMMREIHLRVIRYLYEQSSLREEDFAFNDTGDGYLITFLDSQHSFSCILCACHIRAFLRSHLDKFNTKLGLKDNKPRYSFGMGLHCAKVRLIGLQITTYNAKVLKKKIIIGNASNSAARVESVSKNFLDIDLLMTGYTREQAGKQCNKAFKHLLERRSQFLVELGGRFNIQDGKADGHRLYYITDEFYQEHNRIASAYS